MRPPVLNPLFAPITTLPGIGSKVDRLYRRLLGRDETPRIIDLVFHLPTGTIDRRAQPKLRDVVPGGVVTVTVTVDGSGGKMEHEIDDAGRLVTAEQAAIEPLDLRSDAREGRDRREQRVEDRRAHRLSRRAHRRASHANHP